MIEMLARTDRQAQGLIVGEAHPRLKNHATRVLSVASGKGGVGKTNVTVNLAIRLAQGGRKVLVFDADLGLANVDLLLGLRPTSSLRDVVEGRCGLSETLMRGPCGIEVVPGGCGLGELANLSAFGRGRLLRQLAEIEGAYDVVLIDASAGIGDQVVEFLRATGEVLLVTTPEPTAIADAYALVKVTIAQAPEVSFRLVVNNARDLDDGLVAAARLKNVVQRFLKVSLPVWGILPHSPEVPLAVRQQVPVVVSYPDSDFSVALDSLSRRVVGQAGGASAPPKRGLSDVLRDFAARVIPGLAMFSQ